MAWVWSAIPDLVVCPVCPAAKERKVSQLRLLSPAVKDKRASPASTAFAASQDFPAQLDSPAVKDTKENPVYL